MRTEIQHIVVDRKTYIKGTLKGKYWAEIDKNRLETKSDYFDLNIYEAKVYIEGFKKFEDGEFEEYKNEDLCITPIPNPINCFHKTNGFDNDIFQLNILEHKLTNIELYKIVNEKKESFGTIKANIYGYILDKITVPIEIEIPDEPDIPPSTLSTPPKKTICEQDLATGNFQTKDRWSKRYIRYEYYNKDCTKYWSKWLFKETIEADTGFWLGRLILFLITLMFAFVLFKVLGWKAFLLVGLFVGGFFLLANYGGIIISVFKWFVRGLSFLFLLGILGGLISLFKNGLNTDNRVKRNNYSNTDDRTEITDTTRIDSNLVIEHKRNWLDYNKKLHNCNLRIYVNDYMKSKRFNANQYADNNLKSIYYKLNDFDDKKLKMIYDEFDRLRILCQFKKNDKEFADLIVSCIQDIPYALVLPYSCNPYNITDEATKELRLSGCDCEPFISNGVQSPVEFMANLKGDCDTRSLFLFKILQHFEFKTLLLASEHYKHAIIAVNIPNYHANDLRIKFKNEYYHVWETTSPNTPIGVLSSDCDNLNLWEIYLN